MGRRRTKNTDLPPRMQRKGRNFYYVYNDKWKPLGPDLNSARRQWAELEGLAAGESVAGLVERYIARERRADATLKQYRSYLRAIKEDFPVSAAALTSQHVALWRETQRERKSYANGVLALLTAAMRLGEELGLARAIHVSPWKLSNRDVLPEGNEHHAIASKGPAFLKVAVEIAELIGPRISDILTMRWTDVQDGYLYMRAKKSGQRQRFLVTPELQAVLDRAKSRRIVGLYIVADDSGRPVTYDRFNRRWAAARTAAGVREALHFHDIRAKAATDADAAGQDAQKLLGHTNSSVTRGYLRGRRTVTAEPVKRERNEKKAG
jgi:integrase